VNVEVGVKRDCRLNNVILSLHPFFQISRHSFRRSDPAQDPLIQYHTDCERKLQAIYSKTKAQDEQAFRVSGRCERG